MQLRALSSQWRQGHKCERVACAASARIAMSNQLDALNAWVQDMLLELACSICYLSLPATASQCSRQVAEASLVSHDRAGSSCFGHCHVTLRTSAQTCYLGIAGACAAVNQAFASTPWHVTASKV